ncbi:MAG TPA: UvrD-helicase domain-containing protein, partial [Candidatus Tectomicrobia bacterium]|nr:UvrD-helicase domain-containing protein [Candidatus Tectomicrobia bacterium]
MTSRPAAPDQAQRDAAVAERRRNVLIDAGAGTGKTTILVERLVRMLAPPDGSPAVSIDRIVAITFTRKAAGELRLRIRERLLAGLASAHPGSPTEAQLRHALAGLDTAWVGTVHSFADRLLRLRPVEAALSPSYEIAEDETPLVRETVSVLLQAVESDTLAGELDGTPAVARAAEATETVVNALGAGVRAESEEFEWGTRHGLDGLVAGLLAQRDVPPPDAEPAGFDREAFRRAAEEFLDLARPVRRGTPGADWIVRTAATLRRLLAVDDPVTIYRDVVQQVARLSREASKRDTFGGDDVAWAVWKAFDEGRGRPRPLKEELLAPLHRWLATRLVRLFPVVTALHERVKARHRVLDQLDLLVKLRDLLRDRPDVRREFQGMIDHVFVDEFQDTDPLQAEIVLFLCEREARARRWDEVELGAGRLTLVGDPKQSIYRFRRADVAMYDRVREIVQRSGPLEVRLSANFRSVPPLIDWLNDRFARVLGVSPDGRAFDPTTGVVYHQALDAGRRGGPDPAVQVVPFDFPDGGHKVDEYRLLEAEVLARYLRWLVESSGLTVEDPLLRRRRAVGWGDIAILAVSTWRLPLLFPRLDAAGIPYASRGGTLFLDDQLHRQFLLGLRALADRDDGVAEA